MLGWHIGGSRLGIGTGIGLTFILVTGVWPEAMISIYLCGIAVIISFISGTLLGIWAANNSFVSAILRPINDTLQTMPLFVILIPFVMIFKIGEFTALLAIIAYAIVPKSNAVVFCDVKLPKENAVSYTHLRAHETREDLVFRGLG